MAICKECGARHKMNWVRIPVCKLCRGGKVTDRPNQPVQSQSEARMVIPICTCATNCDGSPELPHDLDCPIHSDPRYHCFREDSPTEECVACGMPANKHTGCDCDEK